jgi:hypothetical protein
METNQLLIVVSEGRYDMYGYPNLMNRFRAIFVKVMGGISDTVAPGTYKFKIVRRGFRLYTELTPYE